MIYVRTYYTWKKIVFSSLARAFKDQVLRRSFLYYTHTCRLPAGTTAAIVVCTADRTRYTHTTYNGRMGAHTTAPLTICFVPTISVLIYLLVVYISNIILVLLATTHLAIQGRWKKIKTTAVGTTQTTTSRWPLFRVFPKYKTSLYTYSATLRLFVDVLFH